MNITFLKEKYGCINIFVKVSQATQSLIVNNEEELKQISDAILEYLKVTNKKKVIDLSDEEAGVY